MITARTTATKELELAVLQHNVIRSLWNQTTDAGVEKPLWDAVVEAQKVINAKAKALSEIEEIWFVAYENN